MKMQQMTRRMVFLVMLGAFMMARAPGAQVAPQANVPTFAKDVAPILQRSCQTCHRPGEIAPMSLLTYVEARPWARSIKTRVSTREMPPWQIDKTVGIQEYHDDISLSDAEIDTIVRWADGGAPQGNPADLPTPKNFSPGTEWVIGKPDLIVNVKEYVVPAEGADQFFDVEVSPEEIGLQEDRYIKAMQFMPGNRKVLHHSTVFAIDDSANLQGGSAIERGPMLLNWAAGKEAERFPAESGKLLKKGAGIAFSQHYHSIGEGVLDRSRLGLVLYPKGFVPKYRTQTVIIGSGQNREPFALDFQAGAENVRTDFYYELTKPAKVLDFQAHMHYRGKAMSLEAILPNGKRELLSNVEPYNWAWQYAYAYKNPPVFPAGTMLHVVGYHDNSSKNRHNPDPGNWVGYGPRTVDEMSMGVTNLVFLTDEDYQQIVNAKKMRSGQ